MKSEQHAAAGTSRREVLFAAAGAMAVGMSGATRAAEPDAKRTGMGIATDAWSIHARAQRARGQGGGLEPLAFLEECHRLGAGGVQGPLGMRDAAYLAKLRQSAEDWAMFVEASVDLSSANVDPERFEAQVVAAKSAGVKVIRTVVTPGRRYEQFNTADEFTKAYDRALEVLQRVEPIVAKHKVRLAVENHKDHRIDERLKLFGRLSSEYIGMCLDFGNSFSLCEDPLEMVRAFAKWTYSVHLKDQAAREYEQGFLYADVPLGKGFLDLPAMVQLVRQAHPEAKFCLEVITRDPLRVPVLTEKYWVTMPLVPATDLARTMRTVRAKAPAGALPSVASLPLEKQVEAELLNTQESIAYARETLKL